MLNDGAPVGLIASTWLDLTDPVIMYGFEDWPVVVTRLPGEGALVCMDGRGGINTGHYGIP